MRWTDVSEKAVEMALRMIPAVGLLTQASDEDDEMSMAAALANGRKVRDIWCQGCGGTEEAPTLAYFACRDGSHGWACRNCRGLVQVG